jgi:hypothetical protein
MRIYFEKGDRVAIFSNPILLQTLLQDWFTDTAGRNKVIADITGTRGTIHAVSPDEGHYQVLYMKDGSKHSWKLPVTVFQLPTPILTALHQYGRVDIYRERP